ncbi:MAG: prolipoprotein diacylglyceryl transferase [Neisseriaceae bacterium]|nr:prolipoprotein diacylglyceryl transferase [Neisseriaceae bacterium]
MIIHPNFNPVAISIGPFSIHWYALSYVLAFILFMWLGRIRIKHNNSPFSKEQLDDLLTYCILGVILGGRLGYCLFYQPAYFVAHPVDIVKVWQGGMSFHGGFLGVALASVLFAKKHKIAWLKCADGIAPLVPLGLASGRMGNFINGELWGRITDPNAFWAMGFPTAQNADIALLPTLPENLQNAFLQYGVLPRHPSPLYEFALEGVVLFIILWLFSKKPRPAGQVAALFLIGYGLFRFIVEWTRQPDEHLGLLSLGLSMGQWLSLPMLLLGLIWFITVRKKSV